MCVVSVLRVLPKFPSGIKALRGADFQTCNSRRAIFENFHDVFDIFLDKFDARKSIAEHRHKTECYGGLRPTLMGAFGILFCNDFKRLFYFFFHTAVCFAPVHHDEK